MIPQAQPVMQTTYCPYCSVQLSYPQGSMFIQCPKCRNTMNPQAPQHTPCHNCGTLLAHPANSICIQCPKCLYAMNARERPSQPTQTIPQTYHHYVPTPQSAAFLGKTKKRKDPNAPKASSNAYMIFCKERRSKLKEDHPELPFGKLGAKLGEIWRNMTPEAKKPYEERAAQDRERYRKQMQEYNFSSPQSMKSDDTQALSSTSDLLAPSLSAHQSQHLLKKSKLSPSSPASSAAEFSTNNSNNSHVSPSISTLGDFSHLFSSSANATLLPPSAANANNTLGGLSAMMNPSLSLSPSSSSSSLNNSFSLPASTASSAGGMLTNALLPNSNSNGSMNNTQAELIKKLQQLSHRPADLANFMDTLRLLTGATNLNLSTLTSLAGLSSSSPLASNSSVSDNNNNASAITTTSSSAAQLQSSQHHSNNGNGNGNGSNSGIVGVSAPTIVTHPLPYLSGSSPASSPNPLFTSSSLLDQSFGAFSATLSPLSGHSHLNLLNSFNASNRSSSCGDNSSSNNNNSSNGSLNVSAVRMSVTAPDPNVTALANAASLLYSQFSPSELSAAMHGTSSSSSSGFSTPYSSSSFSAFSLSSLDSAFHSAAPMDTDASHSLNSSPDMVMSSLHAMLLPRPAGGYPAMSPDQSVNHNDALTGSSSLPLDPFSHSSSSTSSSSSFAPTSAAITTTTTFSSSFPSASPSTSGLLPTSSPFTSAFTSSSAALSSLLSDEALLPAAPTPLSASRRMAEDMPRIQSDTSLSSLPSNFGALNAHNDSDNSCHPAPSPQDASLSAPSSSFTSPAPSTEPIKQSADTVITAESFPNPSDKILTSVSPSS